MGGLHHFPDPFARTVFTVEEVEARIGRYPNPARPGELFQWEIHGRLLRRREIRLPKWPSSWFIGGTANEYEFIFRRTGPRNTPTCQKRSGQGPAGVAQHIASLEIPVLVISLPGHYSRKPWPPIPERRRSSSSGKSPATKN